MPPNHKTIWNELELTLDDADKWDTPNPSSFAPGIYIGGDQSIIVGLAYRTDYRAEEEYGARDLRTFVTSDNPRQFQMQKEARDAMTVFTNVNGIVFHITRHDKVPATAKWGEPLWDFDDGRYAQDWEQSRRWVRGYPSYSYFNGRLVADLRQEAKSLGITPLPTRRGGLESAISERLGPTRPDVWPAWFKDGKHLVLRADDGVAAKIISKLIEAAELGTLGIGDGSGPFSTGMFFYDTRDETLALRQRREHDFDWYDEHIARVKPVVEALKPQSIQFRLDSPRLDEDGEIRYYLSRSFAIPHKYREYDNEYGLFTLAELFEKAGLPTPAEEINLAL